MEKTIKVLLIPIALSGCLGNQPIRGLGEAILIILLFFIGIIAGAIITARWLAKKYNTKLAYLLPILVLILLIALMSSAGQ